MPLTDEQAEHLYAMVKDIHAAMLARRATPPRNGGAPATSSSRQHSGTAPKHDPNDPVVKVQPKGWKGEDLRGRRFSECPPNFLGMLSHMLDAFADKSEEDGDPQKLLYAKWDRENAETARRWRAKLEGKTSTSGAMTQAELDEAF